MSKRSPDESNEATLAKQPKVEATESKPSEANLTCSHCKESGFGSRNKLFKHYKFCTGVLKLPKLEDISDVQFNENHDAYIYVTGGRIRGKTLGELIFIVSNFTRLVLTYIYIVPVPSGYVERYSIRRNIWEKCPNMLENRGSHCSAVVDNIVYVIGGGGFHSNLDSNEKLNCATDKWEAVASMPTSRHALVGLTVGTDVYTIGKFGYLC